jgi:hypothetical protein
MRQQYWRINMVLARGDLLWKLKIFKVHEDLRIIFIDLGKIYNRVRREVMQMVLEKKRVSLKYIKLIKDTYDKDVTSVKTNEGITREFPITKCLYQGLVLSPYLFALVMYEL